MMDKKTINTLLTIAAAALVVGGLILLAVSMFGETKDSWALSAALAAICLANLFNIIRIQRERKAQRHE